MNIDRSVIEQALEWVEAQPEPRMLGAAKIITALREALAQPQPVVQSVQASQCHNVMCQPYCDATGELVLPLCKCKPANQQKD